MKKKILYFLFVIIVVLPIRASAGRGCCSHHGGVAGCSSSGKQICADGSLSPSCTCTPPKVYGCTDRKANNYNSSANQDDGSCTYTIYGCTDPNANNYDPNASQNDGGCTYTVYGCMNPNAINYNANANQDDGSCMYNDGEVSDYVNSSVSDEAILDGHNNLNEINPIPTILFVTSLVGGTYVLNKNRKKK